VRKIQFADYIFLYLLGNKKLQVCRHALAQPQILPPSRTDEISEPLMNQLVSDRHRIVYLEEARKILVVLEQHVISETHQMTGEYLQLPEYSFVIRRISRTSLADCEESKSCSLFAENRGTKSAESLRFGRDHACLPSSITLLADSILTGKRSCPSFQ